MKARRPALRVPAAVIGAGLLVPALLGAAPPPPAHVPAPATAAAVGSLAAPMPSPAVVAQGVSSANQAHLFKDRAWDFAVMRAVFNAVALLPGDQGAVEAARKAGLAVVLEFDYKAEFFAGEDISAKVDAVARQIRDDPGTVSAIHVADRLNEKYSPEQGLRYLAATGGVLHQLVPGVPVLVNASDWELTCGRPGQSSCTGHDERFRYETNATVDAFVNSGYLDGVNIADNIKNLDVGAQAAAWHFARARWPAPFLLWSTCSQLSFGERVFPGTPDPDPATRTYMLAPVAMGADAVALWAWHQAYDGSVATFLDKDGSSNTMWASMTTAAARIVAAGRDEGRLAALAAAPPDGVSGVEWAALVAVALVGLVALGAVRWRVEATEGGRSELVGVATRGRHRQLRAARR